MDLRVIDHFRHSFSIVAPVSQLNVYSLDSSLYVEARGWSSRQVKFELSLIPTGLYRLIFKFFKVP